MRWAQQMGRDLYLRLVFTKMFHGSSYIVPEVLACNLEELSRMLTKTTAYCLDNFDWVVDA